MNDLLDDLSVGGMRTRLGPPRPIPQPVQAAGLRAAQPGVVVLAADAELTTRHRHVAGHLIDVAQNCQLATHRRIIQWITHRSPNDEETQVSTIFLSSRPSA
jgi:hypothetical protein